MVCVLRKAYRGEGGEGTEVELDTSVDTPFLRESERVGNTEVGMKAGEELTDEKG